MPKAQVGAAANGESRILLKTISPALGVRLGATRMNNLRMIRTRLDNRKGTSPRSRTDLNGAGRPHRNLRIRMPGVRVRPNARGEATTRFRS